MCLRAQHGAALGAAGLYQACPEPLSISGSFAAIAAWTESEADGLCKVCCCTSKHGVSRTKVGHRCEVGTGLDFSTCWLSLAPGPAAFLCRGVSFLMCRTNFFFVLPEVLSRTVEGVFCFQLFHCHTACKAIPQGLRVALCLLVSISSLWLA